MYKQRRVHRSTPLRQESWESLGIIRYRNQQPGASSSLSSSTVPAPRLGAVLGQSAVSVVCDTSPGITGANPWNRFGDSAILLLSTPWTSCVCNGGAVRFQLVGMKV